MLPLTHMYDIPDLMWLRMHAWTQSALILSGRDSMQFMPLQDSCNYGIFQNSCNYGIDDTLVRRVFQTESFRASVSALYARRTVASDFAIRGVGILRATGIPLELPPLVLA